MKKLCMLTVLFLALTCAIVCCSAGVTPADLFLCPAQLCARRYGAAGCRTRFGFLVICRPVHADADARRLGGNGIFH